MWECYALGLDPTDVTNDFRIVSIEMVDGKPKVEWEPKVNRWTGAELEVKVKGAERLEGPWADVSEGGSPHHAVLQGGCGVAVAAHGPGDGKARSRCA